MVAFSGGDMSVRLLAAEVGPFRVRGRIIAALIVGLALSLTPFRADAVTVNIIGTAGSNGVGVSDGGPGGCGSQAGALPRR